jgi:butyrate kinase
VTIRVGRQGEATARAIRLARFVNTPLYIVHVMSIDAMQEVAAARLAGARPRERERARDRETERDRGRE